MSKIRIAQYGTKHGHASGKFLALKRNDSVEVAGLFEPDRNRRAELENAEGPYAGTHWYDSADEMLSDPTIAAVASEGLNAESLDQTEAIVAAGKHVWYDKPAGDNWPQWQRVVANACAQNLHIQMGFMLRYSEAFHQVATWARSGFLGHVFSIRANMSTHIPVAAREIIAASHKAGIFYDLAGHVLDQVVWILGRPKKVTGYFHNHSGQVPAFSDNTLGVFEFENALVFIDIAAMQPQPMARRFEVHGDQGSAIIMEPFEPGKQIRLCLQEAQDGYVKGEQFIDLPGSDRQKLYEKELEVFVGTIQGTQQPDRPLDHELLVQETLLRATGGIA
jgi:predicted dehydrogenase